MRSRAQSLCVFSINRYQKYNYWNSLSDQWLGLSTFTAKGLGSIPGQGTKILQAAWHGQKKTKTKNATTNMSGPWKCFGMKKFGNPLEALGAAMLQSYKKRRGFPPLGGAAAPCYMETEGRA